MIICDRKLSVCQTYYLQLRVEEEEEEEEAEEEEETKHQYFLFFSIAAHGNRVFTHKALTLRLYWTEAVSTNTALNQ